MQFVLSFILSSTDPELLTEEHLDNSFLWNMLMLSQVSFSNPPLGIFIVWFDVDNCDINEMSIFICLIFYYVLH